jgi:hypothetical protein
MLEMTRLVVVMFVKTPDIGAPACIWLDMVLKYRLSQFQSAALLTAG